MNDLLYAQMHERVTEAISAAGTKLNAFSRRSHVLIGHYIALNDNSRAHTVKEITGGLGAKYSYYDYLVACYGEAAALKAAIYNQPEEQFGVSWDESLQEWECWLYKKF